VRLLLDTHAFLWFIEGSARLSLDARAAIEDSNNERYLSIASLWEMSIKAAAGKLEIPRPIQTLIQRHITGNAIDLLPIQGEHLETLISLPNHHKDPFDRVLLAQAQVEDLVLISCDGNFDAYDVKLLW